jgi:uncharacterized protein Yka (UPF0111/DUF47 family)
MLIYNIDKMYPGMEDISKKLVDICAATESAVSYLALKGDKKNINQILITIHEIENLCDNTYRDALKNLWVNEDDFKTLIAWKDIFSRVESATDACEHVATILERIRVKYYA